MRSALSRLCAAAATLLVVATCPTVTVAQDVRVVLVNDPLMPDGRIHYPVVISEGRGYRVRCQDPSDEERLISALGFLIPPGQLVDPTDPMIVDAAPSENPLLCPAADNYPIRIFAAHRPEGLKHYLQFVGGFDSEEPTDRLYIPECAGLVDALGIDLSTAEQADPTPFFAGKVHEITCVEGSDRLPTDPQNFADWCMKGDLDQVEAATVIAVLNTTPMGAGARGDPAACAQAQTFLSAVTTRNFSGGGVRSLEPLKQLTQLTSLSLADNEITDITPLSGMTQLTFLDLSGNHIDDINALGTMPLLTSLDLSDNVVTDLRPLSSLNLLTDLNVARNRPDTLRPLQFLAAVTTLNLAGNELVADDLTELTGLQLEMLDLSDNQIEDFSVLANFASAVRFVLHGNPAASGGPASFLDLCILARDDPTPRGQTIRAMVAAAVSEDATCGAASAVLTSSTALDLSGKSISDLEPLATLRHLTNVNLGDNTITDVAPLAALTGITTLTLSNNAITDVHPLAELELMTSLTMAGNPVETDDYLSACIMRTEPNVLSPSHLTEISVLFDASAAQTCKASTARLRSSSALDLRGKALSTVDYVPVAENLNVLLISNNPIANVSALRHLTRLETLAASNTEVTAIDGLQLLRGLKSLDISHTPVSQLSFLGQMPKIRTINFRNTLVRNVRWLDGLPNLQTATMWQAPIEFQGMFDYCIVHRFAPGMLGNTRPAVDGIMAAALSDGQRADDCRSVQEWSIGVTKLNLNNRQISNLNPLRGMRALEELFLFKNRISDTGPISNLRQLRTLNLSDNRLNTIPVIFSNGLTYLYLANNNISNPQPVQRYTALKTLNLNDNRVDRTVGLNALAQLSHLDLRNNRIAQLQAVLPILSKNPFIKGNPICNLPTHLDHLLRPACTREPMIFVNPNLVRDNLGLAINRGLIFAPDGN